MLARFLLGIALALATAGWHAKAQTPAPQQPTEGWHGSVTPYGWFAGISGTATVRDRSASGSADFGDILNDLKFAAMLAAEVRYGRFGLVGDLLYLDMSQGVSTPGDGAFNGGSATLTTTMLGLGAYYRVLEGEAGFLDAGGGIRPWWVDTRLRLNSGREPGRTFSTTVSWTDPFIALRGQVRLAPEWSVSAYGDIGGFGVGSQLTWQVIGTVNYQPRDWLVLSAGWRYIALDFKNGEASLDLGMSGPLLAATFRF